MITNMRLRVKSISEDSHLDHSGRYAYSKWQGAAIGGVMDGNIGWDKRLVRQTHLQCHQH